MVLLGPMTDPTLTSADAADDVAAMRALLEGAVQPGHGADEEQAKQFGVPGDPAVRSRDALEVEAMRTRLDELRARGQLALA